MKYAKTMIEKLKRLRAAPSQPAPEGEREFMDWLNSEPVTTINCGTPGSQCLTFS